LIEAVQRHQEATVRAPTLLSVFEVRQQAFGIVRFIVMIRYRLPACRLVNGEQMIAAVKNSGSRKSLLLFRCVAI
jgi:hypothetical protein